MLIDPPFEAKDEFEKLQRALAQALRRFATGVYLIWYPVKDVAAVAGFKACLESMKSKRTFTAELQIASQPAGGLTRAGVALVNAPWPIEDGLATLGPYLARTLGGRHGRFDLDWVARN